MNGSNSNNRNNHKHPLPQRAPLDTRSKTIQTTLTDMWRKKSSSNSNSSSSSSDDDDNNNGGLVANLRRTTAKRGGASSSSSSSSSSRKRNTSAENPNDPHNLEERFVQNQQLMFDQAVVEIRQGMKRSCWLWFVLPAAPYIVNGQERGSSMNRHFALRGDDAVKAYLTYESNGGGGGGGGEVNLRTNYLTMVTAIYLQIKNGNTLGYLLGPVDEAKAISSFRLFERVSREMGDEELANVCERLLKLVAEEEPKKKKKKQSVFGY